MIPHTGMWVTMDASPHSSPATDVMRCVPRAWVANNNPEHAGDMKMKMRKTSNTLVWDYHPTTKQVNNKNVHIRFYKTAEGLLQCVTGNPYKPDTLY